MAAAGAAASAVDFETAAIGFAVVAVVAASAVDFETAAIGFAVVVTSIDIVLGYDSCS